MYKILKVIFLYFPDSFVERTVIVIHRCYVVLNITLHCFTLSVSIDFKRIWELQKKRETLFSSFNKLTSLEATLVQNSAHWPTDGG